MLLLDTDVLIDYLREQGGAVRFVEGLKAAFAMSVITVAELWAGVRNEPEERTISGLISACKVMEIDEEIARRGGLFRQQFGRSHGVLLPEALIAATSAVRQLELVTLNRRHYPMLDSVTTPYRKAR